MIVTLVDVVRGDNQICVGYKNQYDVINETNGDTLQLFKLESNKVITSLTMWCYVCDEKVGLHDVSKNMLRI